MDMSNQQQAAPADSLQQPLLSRAKLGELVASVAPGERLEPAVEMALMKMAESFLVEVSQSAAELARHRHSNAIEPRDIHRYLEREYDMGLYGYVDSEERGGSTKVVHPTVGHQTRNAHATRAASSANQPRQT